MLEATATNMEATVYGSIHDNYQYFAASPLSSEVARDPGGRSTCSSRDGGNQYGAWIFFRFLCEILTRHHPSSASPTLPINSQIWNRPRQAGNEERRDVLD